MMKIIWLTCKRCNPPHKWKPRKKIKQIRICPKCKSPYWDRERRFK